MATSTTQPQTDRQRVNRQLGIAVTAAMVVSAMVLRAFILPHTGWWRQESDLSAPAGMQHFAGIIFADDNATPVLELIGYSVSQAVAHNGDWIFVDLFWRALIPLEQPWQVKLALSAPLTRAEIATSSHTAPGGFPTDTWTTDKYVKDSHILRLDSPLPYVYDLVVYLFDAENGHLRAAGADYAGLTTLRIAEDGERSLPPGSQPVNIVFGDWLRLRAYEWSSAADNVQLHLFWEALHAPRQEYALMLHFQRAGQTVGNADQPPIPSYPTQLWRAGQYLESVIDLDPPGDADVLVLGLYDRTTIQLVTVVVKGGALETEANGVLLPIVSDNQDPG